MKIYGLIISFMLIFCYYLIDKCSCANNLKSKFTNMKSSKKGGVEKTIISNNKNLANKNGHYIENDEMNSIYGKINVKILKRDMTDYSGDNLHLLGLNTEFTPLVKLPPPVKNEKMDELPVIWQSGPLKGKIMTEEDFPKPFGYYYSEYKTLHPEQ